MPEKQQNVFRPSLSQIENHPPAPDELEVSLFGPGIGECIVVHLGDGNWMVIDSCLESSTREPIALAYLNRIGVNPATSVKVLAISHWHDDHILGSAKTLSVCESARVCYSAALLKEEFLTLTSSLSDPMSLIDRKTSGTREMASIVRVLESRSLNRPNYKSDQLVPTVAHCLLYQHDNGRYKSEITALSPSSASVNNALREFASLIPMSGADRRVIPRPTQNHNSIVIWLRFGENSVLLGSDLEETRDPYTGWSVIVNSDRRPSGKAKIFKIPHHGSRTGHSDEVWNHIVETEATGVMTTFNRGKTPIPREEDINRIKRFTSNLYCTMEPKAAMPRRDTAVERTLREMAKNRKVLGGEVGHIQVRMKLNSQIRVNLQPPATRL